MLKTKVSTKGQVTLPKSVRDELKIGPGTELEIILSNGTIQLQKIEAGWRALRGAFADGPNLVEALLRDRRWEIERDERRARRR